MELAAVFCPDLHLVSIHVLTKVHVLVPDLAPILVLVLDLALQASHVSGVVFLCHRSMQVIVFEIVMELG